MKARRERRYLLFFALAFFSALCAAQTVGRATSIDFVRYLDDEGIEKLQLRCQLPDDPNECELIKQRNEFIVDRTRVRREVVDQWMRAFFHRIGSQTENLKARTPTEAQFLSWDMHYGKWATRGEFSRQQMMRPLKGSLAVLHASLAELEAALNFSFAKR